MSKPEQASNTSRSTKLEAAISLASLQKEANWKSTLFQHGGDFVRGAGRALVDPFRAVVRKFNPEAFGPKPTWYTPKNEMEAMGRSAAFGGVTGGVIGAVSAGANAIGDLLFNKSKPQDSESGPHNYAPGPPHQRPNPPDLSGWQDYTYNPDNIQSRRGFDPKQHWDPAKERSRTLITKPDWQDYTYNPDNIQSRRGFDPKQH
jgi:hypothetical protein